jgi:hypothetical protein
MTILRFCEPPFDKLPILFDINFKLEIASFRKFRHIVFHGYSFKINWLQMEEGIEKISDIFSDFRSKVSAYLNTQKK